MPMGSTCTIRTTGMNAIIAVIPASSMPTTRAAQKAASTSVPWKAKAAATSFRASAGCLRRLVTPKWTEPRNCSQFSLSRKRPRIFWWEAR